MVRSTASLPGVGGEGESQVRSWRIPERGDEGRSFERSSRPLGHSVQMRTFPFAASHVPTCSLLLTQGGLSSPNSNFASLVVSLRGPHPFTPPCEWT